MEYFAFQWHITDSCDQRCEHCYIFSEGHPKLVEMPLGRAQQVVDDCVEMCRRMERLPYFYITGGDPILHSRFGIFSRCFRSGIFPLPYSATRFI